MFSEDLTSESRQLLKYALYLRALRRGEFMKDGRRLRQIEVALLNRTRWKLNPRCEWSCRIKRRRR